MIRKLLIGLLPIAALAMVLVVAGAGEVLADPKVKTVTMTVQSAPLTGGFFDCGISNGTNTNISLESIKVFFVNGEYLEAVENGPLTVVPSFPVSVVVLNGAGFPNPSDPYPASCSITYSGVEGAGKVSFCAGGSDNPRLDPYIGPVHCVPFE